jgi:hypothetical protein
MKTLTALLFLASGCAPLDGINETMDIRGRAERVGTALRLTDGRLIGVRVIKMENTGVGVRCGKYVAPDYIYIYDDPKHCPSLELLLQHELGHAYGLQHTRTGIMAELPGNMGED